MKNVFSLFGCLDITPSASLVATAGTGRDPVLVSHPMVAIATGPSLVHGELGDGIGLDWYGERREICVSAPVVSKG
jgi:hypothetical protein